MLHQDWLEREDRERPFRLNPYRPKTDSGSGMSPFLRKILQSVAFGQRRSYSSGGSYKSKPYMQRCAVKFSWIRQRPKGAHDRKGFWAAHGRYIARRSASGKPVAEAGFNAKVNGVGGVPEMLDGWQAAGDQRMWKLVISPEQGKRVNLTKLARKMMKQMEKDLGTKLTWVAVEHRNTEHPHVHVALRGVMENGEPLAIPPEYLKRGMRMVAEAEITRILGPRKRAAALADQGWRMNQPGTRR